ncbi:hypothetical protein CF326_g8337 [Tilletia indica]|nr:hypothetical protein CF326_g8337 [Tilletia indica]
MALKRVGAALIQASTDVNLGQPIFETAGALEAHDESNSGTHAIVHGDAPCHIIPPSAIRQPRSTRPAVSMTASAEKQIFSSHTSSTPFSDALTSFAIHILSLRSLWSRPPLSFLISPRAST